MDKKSLAEVYAEFMEAVKADETKSAKVESPEETPTESDETPTEVSSGDGFDAVFYETVDESVENDE